MKKPKSNIQIMSSIRREWTINPRTRIQDNEKRDKKKNRQENKRLCRECA